MSLTATTLAATPPEQRLPSRAVAVSSRMHVFSKQKATPERWSVELQNGVSAKRSGGATKDTDYAGETDVPDTVRDVISSLGQSLDADIQRTMESEMGDGFSDVQVHTGPQAAQACEDINAKAFTVGNNIAFNRGEYDPGSAEGQHTIAHELAHVRQQTGGAVSMLPQDDLDLEIDPDPELEQEAEETAQRVMQGGELGIHRMSDTDVHVQRADKESDKYSKRDFLNGEPSAEEMATAIDEVIDPQRVLEQMVSQASDIDWVSVLKKAGIAAAETNAVTSATIAAGDEIDSQMRDDSVAEDDLIAQLDQHDPPQSWVNTIAEQAADIVQNDETGETPPRDL